jgi:arsenite methyltransferase
MESTTSVQEQVKEKYGSAARAVAESGSVQACCDPGLRCCDPITTNLYSADQTGDHSGESRPGLARVR